MSGTSIIAQISLSLRWSFRFRTIEQLNTQFENLAPWTIDFLKDFFQ